MSVTRVSKEKFDLGEGPHWDVNTQRLYHVDAFLGDVHRLDPTTGNTERFHFDGIVTFVIPYQKDPNSVLITLNKEIRKLNFTTGESERVAELVSDYPNYRYNDGKCDTRGRLWTGTLVPGEKFKGHLIKMESDYNLQQLADKISLSNGLAWSLNDNTMYFIDSEEKLIYVFDFNIETGTATNQRVFVDYSKDEEYKELGVPDGMTIDIEGKLWVANYGAGCVIRIDPQTKSIIRRVNIPSKYTTSCCFGGPHFDTLYVTTGSRSEENATQPDAGAVFAVTNLGTRGQPPNHFAG